MYKKLIQIDLDGVLNNYDGHYKAEEIPPVKKGAYEFLEKLSQNFELELFTVRNKKICELWLKENKMSHFFVQITDIKNPFASVFVDDRAINFNGDYDKLYLNICEFQPYWKK